MNINIFVFSMCVGELVFLHTCVSVGVCVYVYVLPRQTTIPLVVKKTTCMQTTLHAKKYNGSKAFELISLCHFYIIKHIIGVSHFAHKTL